MRRKVALLGFFLAVATLLSGCGKQDEELENYKKSMIYEYVTGKKEVPQS